MSRRSDTTNPIHTDLKIVPLGFLVLVLVGALLLRLPGSRLPGVNLSWIDALFTAVSAVCVTGLLTIDLSQTFTLFGQAVVLGLIQLGGLGIMTVGTFITLLVGRRLSLRSEFNIQGTLGKLKSAHPRDIFVYACVFVIIFELAGTVLLFSLITSRLPEQDTLLSLWQAAFHSVSAFCNAGISTLNGGLVSWKDEARLLATIDALVIVGGIGLLTLVNIRFYYPWRKDARHRGRLSLQTKIALFMAAVLLVTGALATLILEWNHSFAKADWPQKCSWAFFHSAMTRTAGFSVADLNEMHPATLHLSMALMFVGGAPGSMAGGIKTTTAALLLLSAWTSLRRMPDVNVFRRRVPRSQVSIAVLVTLLAAFALLVSITILFLTENELPAAKTNHHWHALIFEAVSAFGTVGLSTGVTPLLSSFGKFLIVMLMFAGRVGPLMLTVYLCRPARLWHMRHPEETISLG